MESLYKILHKAKYRELLYDAERWRVANSMRGPRRAGAGAWAWTLIGVVAAVALVVLLRLL
jgi:hypothetical protein